MITSQLTLKQDFLLDPEITFLNHGSFGATPQPVFERYQKWQRELENQPVEFLGRRANSLLSSAREVLANYLGTQRDNLVYVTNVTEALNIIARSLKLEIDDEVLASNMEYGALDRTWRFLAQKQGFKYINQPLSVPVQNQEEVVKDFWKGVNNHTRVIFLSHISSPTAMIFPVKAICQLAKAHHIITVIDGAHTPGQIELNLEDIGADFYGANCHKWLCAPKGAGFLFAAPHVQPLVEPLIVSWGWQSENPGPSQFVDYLEWTGTRDIAAFLSVPEAIRYQQERNWAEIRTNCHSMAKQAMLQISALTGLSPLYPATNEWFAQMGTARLPESIDILKLHDDLWNQFRIEIPTINWNGTKLIRFSFQAYNSDKDTDRLLMALQKLLN
jgi:isopenicillin-N epimerase